MTDTTPPPKAEPTRAVVVGKIVARLSDEALGTGPLAELRRLDPAGPLSAPALHRLLARHVPDDWLRRSAAVRDWALVIHGLALAAPDNLRGEARLGKALHDAGFGETRLGNLLDAGAADLRVRLPRAVRFLVHRGQTVHGPQLADLALTRPDTPAHDMLRQRIAADYYRAEHKAAQPEAASAT